MFCYKDSVVMITGASSGLGLQMANGFASQGADLVIIARREEKLNKAAEELRKEYGVKVLPIVCDVTKTEEINNAVEKAISEYGKIDVLVNNAGSSKGGAINEMTDEAWQFTMDVDLTSVFKMTRAVSAKMIERKYGRIINIASMYGIMGTNQEQVAYHASKAGVINFTRAVAAELAPKGITCNAIAPGFFTTELTVDTLETEAFKGYMNISVPMARPGKEGELNPCALFLGSKEATYVTGQTIAVDGGWSTSK